MDSNVWPQERREQLARLERLLDEVTSINHGSQCLQRIARCIDEAEALRRDDITTLSFGLMTWLKQQANGDGDKFERAIQAAREAKPAV